MPIRIDIGILYGMELRRVIADQCPAISLRGRCRCCKGSQGGIRPHLDQECEYQDSEGHRQETQWSSCFLIMSHRHWYTSFHSNVSQVFLSGRKFTVTTPDRCVNA